jgi:RNA methyltransferase, TrmH family
MAPRSPAAEARPIGSPGRTTADSREGLIASRDNKWLRAFRAALRGTGPEAGELLGVEGPKLVEVAVRSGLETEALLVSEAGESGLERVLRAAAESEKGIPRSRVFRTTDKLFAGVAGTETPQGLAALCRPREWTFDDVLRGRASREGAYRGEPPLVVVICAVQDPGNVGTIVRSAEAFDATGLVATRGTADPWSPKAIRASAGSALRLPLLRGLTAPVLLAQLRVAELRLLAAVSGSADPEDGPASSPDWRQPTALFIGNEGAGLPREVLGAADSKISIPLSDEVESLNAGVAASVLLYQAARCRRHEGSA